MNLLGSRSNVLFSGVIGRPIRRLSMMLLLILAGCGVNNVVIEGSFPTPAIEKLPLDIAVFYDESLKDFSYIEYSETGDEEYNIESGISHMALFDTIIPAMFDNVSFIESLEETENSNVDAVFVPMIEEFQLALPSKTRLGVYEVWIKYNMRLMSPDGEYIADWVLTSYGKTPTETFRSSEAAINEAAIVALRDLASSFSLSFSQVPEVRDWLSTL